MQNFRRFYIITFEFTQEIYSRISDKNNVKYHCILCIVGRGSTENPFWTALPNMIFFGGGVEVRVIPRNARGNL